MRVATTLIVLALWTASMVRGGENWPQWRGPQLTGVSDSTGLPVSWSDTENIAWKTPLPAWGGSTPIVWGERVFVTSPSEPTDRGGEGGIARRFPRGGRQSPGGSKVLLLCFDKQDGKELWRRTLDSKNELYGKQNSASPSPVTDGTHVWALTGTGVLTAFDFDGNEIWRHDLQDEYGAFGLVWGYASSPLLYEGKVVVQVLHGAMNQNPSYIVAFDGQSGEVVWKTERKTDATRECPDAYTTPTLWRSDGKVELIISGADYVTGHDPDTGRELWRAGGLNPEKRGNYRVCQSPVVSDGIIFAGSRVRPLLALRGGGRGDVSASHLVWKYEAKGGPDVPTPVCHEQRLFLVDDRGLVTCLHAKTGEVVWGPKRTAIGTVSASPLLADGKLYVTNEQATTTVLAAGPAFKVLSTNELDDAYTLSSIAVSGPQLFVRTSTHLYCVGKPGPR